MLLLSLSLFLSFSLKVDGMLMELSIELMKVWFRMGSSSRDRCCSIALVTSLTSVPMPCLLVSLKTCHQSCTIINMLPYTAHRLIRSPRISKGLHRYMLKVTGLSNTFIKNIAMSNFLHRLWNWLRIRLKWRQEWWHWIELWRRLERLGMVGMVCTPGTVYFMPLNKVTWQPRKLLHWNRRMVLKSH
jgi:hypothetical protein